MRVPPPNHNTWKKLLMREVDPKLVSLPARVTLSRLRLAAMVDGSPTAHARLSAELQHVFAASVKQPAVQNDLKALFDEGDLT